MAFSMIVEITSETPAGDLEEAGDAAQAAPPTIASRNATITLSGPGSQPWPANAAAAKTATRYWPSTPMLNRFIRNPIAAASAER